MAPSGTMRVVVYNQPGDASVLKVEERPIPKRGDGEVLVKQYGTSVNPVDYKMRSSNKEHLPKVRISVEHQSLGMPEPTRFFVCVTAFKRAPACRFQEEISQGSLRKLVPAARSATFLPV